MKHEWEIPASFENLGLVSDYLAQATQNLSDLPDTWHYNLQLAVHEICANIVEHAYRDCQGEITIIFDVAAHALTVHFRDTGNTFALDNVPEPILDDDPQERGLGLFLVRQLVDEMHYSSDANGNHWQLVKYY